MERVRIHETSGDIYISEKVFNAIWPSIRESILIGIEKGIKYEMIQIPEEERKLKSRRQSLMDNREMIFCYSKQGDMHMINSVRTLKG